MHTDLVLTVIGDDRPGLVEQLAATIAAQGGNWLESSMSHLAGKFAGIVRVQCDDGKLPALQQALESLQGLSVTAQRARGLDIGAAGRRFTLSLVGHDRVGIVREVSQVLARHAINVESLSTWTSSAPMSGDLLFHAEAELHAASGLDARALKDQLEALSTELAVDIAEVISL